MNNIKINKKSIDKNKKCFVIAEVAQSHDGSLGIAHSFIDKVAEAGADAVKFQTHIASAESTKNEKWRIKFSKQDKSRYDYWKRMEFSKDQWLELKRHANKLGLEFLSSPFSLEAVRLLEEINIPAWKIPSGEVSNIELIEEVCKTNKPVLLSSGISFIKEIDEAVNICKKNNVKYGIFQCTTSYPCPPNKIGINLISEFVKKYKCPIGLSDHSSTIFPSLIAAHEGASMLEVHVTLDKNAFGPDVGSSVDFLQLKQITEGVSFIHLMNKSPVNKNKFAQENKSLRKLFTKSLVFNEDLCPGITLSKKNIGYKKPGGGLDYKHLKTIIGKKLKKKVKKDDLITFQLISK